MLHCNMPYGDAPSAGGRSRTMAWIQDFPGMDAAGERTEKAWRMPLGAVSPLWAVFGAAASAGIAYWWLTQWSRAAVNFEALAGVAPAAKPAQARIESVAKSEPAPEPRLEAVIESPVTAAALEAVVEPEPAPGLAIEAVSESPEALAALEAVAAAEPIAEAEAVTADDLTVMTGIGPKLSAALAERGVTRFAQIAAWSADDLATIDSALSLKGRAVREAWVAQAKRLAKEA
jgi:predicted flap endonuclease-1-like 5' DNA nuclease